jgi:hypothetical protein
MPRYLLAASLFLFALTSGNADDAIDEQGKRHAGQLVFDAGKPVFRSDDAKSAPLSEYSYIRFPSPATPLPKVPLTHTLHLPHQQRIAGILGRVDAKKLVFVTAWGTTVELERNQVVGIEQARNGRILLHDFLDSSLQDWQLDGNPKLDRERAFHGIAGLLLDQPKQRATRVWKSALTDGDVRLFYYDDGKSRFWFDVIAGPTTDSIVTLDIDVDGYHCGKGRATFGVLKRLPGWHQLHLELSAGRLRVYVNDSCLGETKVDAIQGIRVVNQAGRLWVDELTVAQRLPALPLPVPAKEHDLLWLTHGEQLFGQVSSADRKAIAFDSKLGKRSLAWPQVRGIFFAQSKSSFEPTGMEITFRPGPGFPLDQLHARLLRWDADKLIVHHELLGEIAVERDRLNTIRPLAK